MTGLTTPYAPPYLILQAPLLLEYDSGLRTQLIYIFLTVALTRFYSSMDVISYA